MFWSNLALFLVFKLAILEKGLQIFYIIFQYQIKCKCLLFKYQYLKNIKM